MAETRGRDVGARGPEREKAVDQHHANRERAIDEQQHAKHERLADRAPHQTSPEDSEPADRDETGTARRAEEATTGESQPNHLGEAEAAFERDREKRESRS